MKRAWRGAHARQGRTKKRTAGGRACTASKAKAARERESGRYIRWIFSPKYSHSRSRERIFAGAHGIIPSTPPPFFFETRVRLLQSKAPPPTTPFDPSWALGLSLLQRAGGRPGWWWKEGSWAYEVRISLSLSPSLSHSAQSTHPPVSASGDDGEEPRKGKGIAEQQQQPWA